MPKKECPSCAMEIDSECKVCPVCGFEFPSVGKKRAWIVLLLLLVFIIVSILAWFRRFF
ncbi:MAG: hypothetical protein HY064_04640 [Bacteroidetes bacterium]|nr:hypothetical protein [Bacteroidota bacterium]